MFKEAIKGKYKLALIVTVYKRLYNLPVLLRSVSNQTYKEFDTFIVNNNSSDEAKKLLTELSQGVDNCQVLNLELNHGAYIRYVLAKRLYQLGYTHGVFIDDDEELRKDSMLKFSHDMYPKTMRSIRNLIIEGGRMSMAKPKDDVTICNAGGMIIDLSLFDMDSFWNEWESCYRSQDDLYISYFAKKSGWTLGKTSAEVILDGRNGDSDSMYRKPGQNVVEKAFLAQYFGGGPVDPERIVKSKMGNRKPVPNKTNNVIINAPWRQ